MNEDRQLSTEDRDGGSIAGFLNAVPGYDGKRRGTRPDHQVVTKFVNLLRGVDEQLDLALKLADENSNPTKKQRVEDC